MPHREGIHQALIRFTLAAILTGLVLPFAAEAQPTPLPGTREPVEATIIEVVSTTRQLLQGEVSVTMCALELPRRETSGVEMAFVRFGGFAVAPELSLELHLSPPQCFAA